MKKKKPERKEWEQFVADWQSSDHVGKLAIANSYGVRYDTAKHWISENGASVTPQPTMTLTDEDILRYKPEINLDFVSFDIETSNLRADFSVLLTAAIKPFGQPAIVFRGDDYPEWETQRTNDKPITRDIARELSKHAVIITHYGSRGKFDIPFVIAKLIKHRLPPLPNLFGLDSWRIAKSTLAVSSRRLGALGNFLELGAKENVEGKLWMDASYNGSREAMDAIVAHNVVDVQLLENLMSLVFPYTRSIPRA